MKRLYALVIAALCLVPLAALAGGPDRLAFADATTDRIVRTIETGLAACRQLPLAYRPDCIRKTYRDAARLMNGKPDYRQAQQALNTIEEAMLAVEAQYADRTKPTIRVGGRSYGAVTATGVRKADVAYRKAVAEAQTVLLRATGHAAHHYARIARAVGSSSKVLLRA